jgi:ribulose-phosphate 3-epimerase
MYELKRSKKITLAASVSCFNLYNVESQLPLVEEAGVELLHFDVVDGRFNDCFILGTPTLAAIHPHTRLPIAVHLAVYEPQKFISQFVEAGADYIAVHYEAMSEPEAVFEQIREAGARPLLALRAETGVDEGLVRLLPQVDWVVKLTVNPGYAGQSLQPATLDKIRELRLAAQEADLDIGIAADGNINPRTIPAVVAAGADILVGGTSGLFLKDRSIKEAAALMLQAASQING